MSSARDERAVSILLEQAGRYIAREAGRDTLITPTRVVVSKDRKDATIYVSVYPDAQEGHALAFLMRHKDLFRNELKKTTRLARLPYIRFELDRGERNRQHLEELTRELEATSESTEESA
ncbi:MAG: Ribosome-binding factor A [Parcubacteria bacterium C7867-004]|nr:MAG: Ribosome-binding factor A [Parcubacteria bacterium C7867-004]